MKQSFVIFKKKTKQTSNNLLEENLYNKRFPQEKNRHLFIHFILIQMKNKSTHRHQQYQPYIHFSL